MSAKIKVSYETAQEFRTVLKLLHPIIKSCKADKGGNGRYKKAYIEVGFSDKSAQKSANLPMI